MKVLKKIADGAAAHGRTQDGAPNAAVVINKATVDQQVADRGEFGRADADSRAAGRLDWRCAARPARSPMLRAGVTARKLWTMPGGAEAPRRHHVEEAL